MKQPWITIREKDGYVWSERKGIHSVAVVLVRNINDKLEVCLHHERNPAHEEAFGRSRNVGAIGGSLDKGKSPRQTAIEEVREEGGYIISDDDIRAVGTVFATTQSSEHVHLYVADVSNAKYVGMSLEPGEGDYDHANEWRKWSPNLFAISPDPRFICAMARYLGYIENKE